MKLIHLADLHFDLNNIGEYDYLLEQVCAHVDALKKAGNEVIFVVAGDVLNRSCNVDSSISNYAIRFFTTLMNYGKVVMIAGNHDFNDTLNTRWQLLDIAKTCNHMNDNMHYIDRTGCYCIEGIYFAACCLIDQERTFISYEEARAMAPPNVPIICIFHGMLKELGMRDPIMKKAVNNKSPSDSRTRALRDFSGYAAVIMGDIHKHQHFARKAVYCGSLMQLNFGEDNYHGFVVWDYPSLKWDFVRVRQKVEKVRINFSRSTDHDIYTRINGIETEDINLFISYYQKEQLQTILEVLTKAGKNIVSKKEVMLRQKLEQHVDDSNNQYIALNLIRMREDAEQIVLQKLLTYEHGDEIAKLHKNRANLRASANNSGKIFSILSLSLKNFLSYREEQVIPFKDLAPLVVIAGANTSGKSSIICAISAILTKSAGKAIAPVTVEACINRQEREALLQIELAETGSGATLLFQKQGIRNHPARKLQVIRNGEARDAIGQDSILVATKVFNMLHIYQNDGIDGEEVLAIVTQISGCAYLESATTAIRKEIETKDKLIARYNAEISLREREIKKLEDFLNQETKERSLEDISAEIQQIEQEEKELESKLTAVSIASFKYFDYNPDLQADADQYHELISYHNDNAQRMHTISSHSSPQASDNSMACLQQSLQMLQDTRAQLTSAIEKGGCMEKQLEQQREREKLLAEQQRLEERLAEAIAEEKAQHIHSATIYYPLLEKYGTTWACALPASIFADAATLASPTDSIIPNFQVVPEQVVRDCASYKELQQRTNGGKVVEFLTKKFQQPTPPRPNVWKKICTNMRTKEVAVAYANSLGDGKEEIEQLTQRIQAYAQLYHLTKAIELEKQTFHRHWLQKEKLRALYSSRYNQEELRLAIVSIKQKIQGGDDGDNLLQSIQQREQLKQVEADIRQVQSELDAHFVKEFNDKISRLKNIQTQFSKGLLEARGRLNACRRNEWEVTNSLDLRQEKRNQLQQLRIELVEHNKKCMEECKKHSHLSAYHYLLKNNIIKELFVNSFLEYINRELNDLLNGLIDDELIVTFVASDNGKFRLNFTMVNSSSANNIQFQRACGFESTVCELALRCILHRYYQGIKYDTLFIDDAVQKIDSTNIERFGEMLERIGKHYYKRIVLITHNAHLLRLGGSVIQVTRNPPQGSILTIE